MARSHPTFDIPERSSTFPGYNTLKRHKPRRWPLVLRVTKGSVHSDILLPVVVHTLFTSLITYLDLNVVPLGLPGTIIPSLSIVVGLMLVFRNGTSYDRFWTGRNCLQGIVTNVKNLARIFMVSSRGLKTDLATEEEKQDTEHAISILIAFLYAVKHHIRGEYAPTSSPTTPGAPYPRSPLVRNMSGLFSGSATPTGRVPTQSGFSSVETPLVSQSFGSLSDPPPIYTSLLRNTTIASLEGLGVSLPMQLSFSIEAYIRRGLQRDWWIAPQAAMLETTLNAIVMDWQKCDTIRSTPIPTGYIIHQKQVLALYLMILPFSVVDIMGWSGVPVMALTAFTLYGIEGIGRQLEDPFGYDKNDIKMDAVLQDAQMEIEILLDEWKMGRLGHR